MRKGWAITVSIIFSILLAVHLLISVVMFVGLNPVIYKNAQIADEVAEYAGISQATLDKATIGLIDYMEDDREDLVILSDEQEGHELFNAKEKSHMVDVKNLFTLARKVNTAIFIILLIILVFYLSTDKEGMKKYFMKFSAITLALIFGVWLIVAILAIIDFTAFWTVFHKILFTNDLWLLNPTTDLLIRMMPQRFFVRIVIHIIVRFLALYSLVIAILSVGHKLLNKKMKSVRKGRAHG